MAFDWSSLVELADVLQQQAAAATNREAYLRSAVSRAYPRSPAACINVSVA